MKTIKNIPKLKPRAKDAHKGDFGKVCIIAGSIGMSGAAALAGKAALRSGAGLAQVATPKSVLPIVASIEPSFTTIPLPEDDDGKISASAINTILNLIPDNDCLAFGPGLGITQDVSSVLQQLLQQKGLRLVIDADGLNNLSKISDWPSLTNASIILTPHPGEMKRLWTGLFRTPLPADRCEQAMQMANKTKTTIVSKGYKTVVCDGEKLFVNKTGNPGMATGGTGDVLTGIITALVGQGLSNFDAAVLGVHVHGLAGDIAAKKFGQISLIASDVVESLGEAFKKM